MIKQTTLELLNNIIYKWQKKGLFVANLVGIIALICSLSFLIYRYGFYLSASEFLKAVGYFHYLLGIFALSFLIRWLFAFKRTEYLQKTKLEGFLSFFIFSSAFTTYFLKFDPSLFIIDLFWKETDTILVYQFTLTIYLLIYITLDSIKLTNTVLAAKSGNPSILFILSFAVLIGSGTGLLLLPAMTSGAQSMPFIDALFTSVSASCVTGLTVWDTGLYFTLKGQLIILILIQLGGIGIVSFATFFATFLIKNVGLKQQSVIQNVLSSESLISARELLKKIIIITVFIEFIGSVAIFFSWDKELDFNTIGQKSFYSIFHAISAFCNAGFSLFSDSLYTSTLSDGKIFKQLNMDINIRKMYSFQLIIASLIILGGIGFGTLEDLFKISSKKIVSLSRPSQWKLSTRVAMYSSGFLIFLGTVGFMFLEFEQLSYGTIIEALNISFFQSVTTRTAGFNSIDFTTLKIPTLILCMFLMFIGAAPGSTGGGIKCSTFYIIISSAINNIQGFKNVVIHRRSILQDTIYKAYSILIFATTYNLMGIFILTISESNNSNINLIQIAFEQISAFATAGLSMGITSELNNFSKIIIILSMYIGRVGTLTLALALSRRISNNTFAYPEGHVMVG